MQIENKLYQAILAAINLDMDSSAADAHEVAAKALTDILTAFSATIWNADPVAGVECIALEPDQTSALILAELRMQTDLIRSIQRDGLITTPAL